MLKDIETRNFKDNYASNVIQDNNKSFSDQLRNCPFLKGVHIKDISATAITVEVAHKLGRKVSGYIVTKISQPTYPSLGVSTDRLAVFGIDAAWLPVTFDVWVF